MGQSLNISNNLVQPVQGIGHSDQVMQAKKSNRKYFHSFEKMAGMQTSIENMNNPLSSTAGMQQGRPGVTGRPG